MSGLLLGMLDWSLDRDKEGHRDYSISWLIQTDDPNDGPGEILFTPDLPVTGAYWNFGNEIDSWAFCSPECSIKPVLTKEPNKHWTVEQKFSTRPLNRCQDDSIEDPLLEPYRISGSFVNYQQLARFDMDGNPLLSSSLQPLKGSAVEFDQSRPTVNIGFNVASLPLNLIAPAMNYVNDAPLWGIAARCIKLSSCTWKRVLYGTCFYYYTIDYEFDIRWDSFDREVDDYGSRHYDGVGDPNDPNSYLDNRDKHGDPFDAPLDGHGNIVNDYQNVYKIPVKVYQEMNLLTLGIPSSL